MRRHEPGVVWSLRRERMGLDYVRTTAPDEIGPAGVLARIHGATLVMSRMDARLLARRINDLLEATK